MDVGTQAIRGSDSDGVVPQPSRPRRRRHEARRLHVARRRLGLPGRAEAAPGPRLSRHGQRAGRARRGAARRATRPRSPRTTASPRRGSDARDRAASAPKPLPVPQRAGEPSLIEHVVYIIKENRTYDQVFGDMPRGNGDPSLVMFGEDVTPNHAARARVRAARQLLRHRRQHRRRPPVGDAGQRDRLRLWPGYVGRSYPFDGTDPIAYANTGFLWDLRVARGRTVQVYGEYAGRLPESDLHAAPDAARALAATATTSRASGTSRRRSRR